MLKPIHVRLFDLVTCFSNALDLVSPELVNHHNRVAYMSLCLAEELGLSKESRANVVLAALLHDVGAMSLVTRREAAEFQFEVDENDHTNHAHLGHLLLGGYDPFASISQIVKHHHAFWNDRGPGSSDHIPDESYVLHLADRADVLMYVQPGPHRRAEEIIGQLQDHSGEMFSPDVVRSFQRLVSKEYIWLDLMSPDIDNLLVHRLGVRPIELGLEDLSTLGNLFCRLIDFRSRFTATHSSGVAASAEALARFMRFSEGECQMMKVAGFLHDLGKLAVSSEILEKPAKLSDAEFRTIKSHTYHTYRILDRIPGLETVNMWAAFHHERLNGQGYPFHHAAQELTLGCRITAVADVFTAITEDRPYRVGMDSDRALNVLRGMVDEDVLDSSVVTTLVDHFEEVDAIRRNAQADAAKSYQEFWEDTGVSPNNC